MVSSEWLQIVQGQDSLHALLPAVQNACGTTADRCSEPIKIIKETRFLGFIFNAKLSFICHIKYLKTGCLKKLDILSVMSSSELGVDRYVLLAMY